MKDQVNAHPTELHETLYLLNAARCSMTGEELAQRAYGREWSSAPGYFEGKLRKFQESPIKFYMGLDPSNQRRFARHLVEAYQYTEVPS